MVFSDDFLHFLKIKKKCIEFTKNYLVASTSGFENVILGNKQKICSCSLSGNINQHLRKVAGPDTHLFMSNW